MHHAPAGGLNANSHKTSSNLACRGVVAECRAAPGAATNDPGDGARCQSRARCVEHDGIERWPSHQLSEFGGIAAHLRMHFQTLQVCSIFERCASHVSASTCAVAPTQQVSHLCRGGNKTSNTRRGSLCAHALKARGSYLCCSVLHRHLSRQASPAAGRPARADPARCRRHLALPFSLCLQACRGGGHIACRSD